MNEVQDTKFWLWLANHIPKKLVYWCAIVVLAHATSGVGNGKFEASSLTGIDALKCWEKDYLLKGKRK